MKQLLSTCVALSVVISAFAQENPYVEFTPSGEYLQNGVDYHDDENYEKAIEEYSKIEPNDTNYILALGEAAYSYYELEEYEKAVELTRKGIALDSMADPMLYITLGNSLDLLKRPEEAIEAYKSGISKYPIQASLKYNLAVTYHENDQKQNAIEVLQEAIHNSLMHSASHFLLGQIALEENDYVRGYLSIGFGLMIDPVGARSNGALVKLEEYAFDNANTTPEGLDLGEDMFERINQIFYNRVAMDKKFKFDSKIDLGLVRQYYAMFQQIDWDENPDDFWMNTYKRFFTEILDNDDFSTFSMLICSTSGIEKHQKLFKKKQSDIVELYKRIENMAKNEPFYFEDELNGVVSEYPHIYSNSGLVAIGEWENNHPVGKVAFFNGSGIMVALGEFNDEGEQIGEWYFYNSKGIKSTVAHFKGNKKDGENRMYYDNGVLREKSTYADGEYHGEVQTYSYTGAPRGLYTYANGEREGREANFFADSTLRYEVSYTAGKLDGPYRSFHENGQLRFEVNFADDEKEGVQKVYSFSGVLLEESHWKSGKLDGAYTSYHVNGQKNKEGNYAEGMQVGEWKIYHIDGSLAEIQQLDEKGKLKGTSIEYRIGKGTKFFEIDYKDGDMIAWRAYDENEEIVKSGKARGKKLDFEYYNEYGNKTSEGLFESGKKTGLWKYYNEYGLLTSEENYKEGKIHGRDIEYHSNGEIESIFHYKEGERNGRMRRFYPEGGMEFEGFYIDGEAAGTWAYFMPNGDTAALNYYLNDERSGNQYFYAAGNKLANKEVYKNGYWIQDVVYDTAGVMYDSVVFPLSNRTITKTLPNGVVTYKLPMVHGYLQGQAEYFHANGQLSRKGTYVMDEKDGAWLYYQPNGKNDFELQYEMGDLHGTAKYYFDGTGELEREIEYLGDVRNGKTISYYRDGGVSFEAEYIDGERHGEVKYLAPDGTVQVILHYNYGYLLGYSYLNASKKTVEMIPLKNGTGKIEAFFPNGKTSFTGEFLNGEMHGAFMAYNTNGKLLNEENYSYGWRHGVQKEFFKNGKIAEEWSEEYGHKNGEYKVYYSNGALCMSQNYILDKLDGNAIFYKSNKAEQTRIYYFNNTGLY